MYVHLYLITVDFDSEKQGRYMLPPPANYVPRCGIILYICRYRDVCPHPHPAESHCLVGMAKEQLPCPLHYQQVLHLFRWYNARTHTHRRPYTHPPTNPHTHTIFACWKLFAAFPGLLPPQPMHQSQHTESYRIPMNTFTMGCQSENNWRAAPCLHFLGRKPGWVCQNSNTPAAPSQVELKTKNFVGLFPSWLRGCRENNLDWLTLQEPDHDPMRTPTDSETVDENTACPFCRVMVSHGFTMWDMSARPFVGNLGILGEVAFPQPFFSHGKTLGKGWGKPAPFECQRERNRKWWWLKRHIYLEARYRGTLESTLSRCIHIHICILSGLAAKHM